MSHQVESATIEAKQKRLDNKINLANAGIVTIIQKLAQYSSNCPETNEAVAELVSSISPTSDSPNNHVQQEVECNLSSEDIKLICNQVTELFNDLSSFRTELNSLHDEIINMQQKHAEEIKKISAKFEDDLNKAKLQFQQDIKTLHDKQNAQDQYMRSNNLIFRYMKLPEGNCSGAAFAHYVAEIINSCLPMLHIPVNAFNINISHPLGSNSVIVRFTNRHIRNDIYDNKDYLWNYGILVTEHLTPVNVKLLKKAQEIVGKVNAWSYNGKLFAFSQNKTIQITNMDDIINLKNSTSTTASDSNTTNYQNSYPSRGRNSSRRGGMLYRNRGFHPPTNTYSRFNYYRNGYYNNNNRGFYNSNRGAPNMPSYSQVVNPN